jgi:membrane associated rhomboid family serine protease
MKSKFDPRSGLYLDANIVFWMVLWFVVCMVPGFFPRVANAAHAGGLVAGIAIGYAPVLKRKLLRN